MRNAANAISNITIHHAYSDAESFVARYRNVGKFEALCKECPQYGASWACPPFIEGMQIDFTPYRRVMLIGFQTFIKRNYLRPSKTPEELSERSKEISTHVRLMIDPILLSIERDTVASRLFLPGSCNFCAPKGCTRPKRASCRYPNLMRSSLESVGFNVSLASEELLQLHLSWPKDLRLPPFLTFLAAYFLVGSAQTVDLSELADLFA